MNRPSVLNLLRVTAGALLLTGVGFANSAEPAMVRGLFLDVPPPNLTAASRPAISRRRVVAVDIATLRARKAAGRRLPFNLFPDAVFEGVVEQIIERGDDDFTLRGTLSGHPLSSFTLAVKNGVAVMNIRTHDRGVFHLRYLGNSFYDVRQIDEKRYPPCATTEKHAIAAPANAVPDGVKAGGAEPVPDMAATIDVIIFYTPASRTAAGGTAAMEALINLAIDESNTAYERSEITTRLRLVHQQEVAYTESGSFDTDLTRLTSTSDGYIDEVHALRNTCGADLVCMWIGNSSFCGLAWQMTSLSSGFAANAFSTVNWDCATGYYSLAHELGHNMGCAHDRENASGAGLYSYSYGWRFTPTDDFQRRTIMAYAPGERIQNFSNPNVLYNGAPTGVAAGQPGAADNALTINNSALTVANWRQSVVQCGFGLSHVGTNVSSALALCAVSVSASNDCAWTATSQSIFLSITNGTGGMGNGIATLVVATNNSFNARTGAVTIAGQTFTVVQAPAPSLPNGPLTGTISLLNPKTVRLDFQGPQAATLVVEESTDLISWEPVITNLLSPAGAWSSSKSIFGTGRRFYPGRVF